MAEALLAEMYEEGRYNSGLDATRVRSTSLFADLAVLAVGYCSRRACCTVDNIRHSVMGLMGDLMKPRER